MPDTIASLMIYLFAFLPGVPAYLIYKANFGADWRETDVQKVIKVVLFSISGIIIYVFASEYLHLPSPIYLLPATFDSDSFSVKSFMPIALSLSGHFISSIVVAIIIVAIIKLIRKRTSSTPYPAAWDDFIRNEVENHWVVIRLINGEAYAGYIFYADISTNQSERDLVLAEPALYNEEKKNYKIIPYQRLFLPSNMISSIAVAYDPNIDKRISTIGSNLFSEDKNDG